MAVWLQGVPTDAGHAWVAAGGEVVIKRVAAGAGQSNPSDLATMTALADEKKDLIISSQQTEGNQITLVTMLTNEGITEGFELYEIGVFIEDGTETGLLYTIHQATTSDYVPTTVEQYGWINEFELTVAYGSATNVTIQSEGLGAVTQTQLREGLDTKITKPTAHEIVLAADQWRGVSNIPKALTVNYTELSNYGLYTLTMDSEWVFDPGKIICFDLPTDSSASATSMGIKIGEVEWALDAIVIGKAGETISAKLINGAQAQLDVTPYVEVAAYAYEFEIEGITETNSIEIMLQEDPLIAEVSTWQNANIFGAGQSAGIGKIKAYGSKPQIDLPVIVIVGGDD